ncbi:MAG: MCE family protein [Pseudonocardiaceae bacterium]
MINNTIRLQLLTFIVISVLGVGYVSVRYLDAGALLGAGPYPVTLQLTDSGGIFTGADVSYRGVSIGRVGQLRLTRQDADAELEIKPDAPPIPADLDAAVTNLSAIGEQFVELRPRRADGPTLTAGSVIPASRVSTPVPVGDLLANLDTFLRSVPLDSLRTVVDELGTGFTGTGPALQTLLDTSDAFTRDAIAALPQTVALLRDGRVVLETQNEQSSAITSFSQDLALLAAQLRSSDPDIRRLIRTAPRFSAQVSGLLQDSGSQLGQLLADLLTVSRVALPRQAALRQLLAAYPLVIAANASSVVPDDGFAHLAGAQRPRPVRLRAWLRGHHQAVRDGHRADPSEPQRLLCRAAGQPDQRPRRAQRPPRRSAGSRHPRRFRAAISLPWTTMTRTAFLDGPLRTATGVLAAVALLAAGWFGLSWYRAAHDESLALRMTRDTVLQDGQQATVNLNTLDYRRVQDGLTLWEQSATGALLDEMQANRDTYARAITDSKTTTTGRTLDGAVAELDERAGTARVLICVDVTSYREQGDASCVRRRMKLEMRRGGHVWKVDKLAPVDAASPVPGACPAANLSPPK